MGTTAADVMIKRFSTLRPETPLEEAIKVFRQAATAEGRRVFGMMVTDEHQRLVGMLSMYDILLFVRPKHIHIWGMMDDIDVAGVIRGACERVRAIRVGDIMTTEVVTVAPRTHVMMVLDVMIKKHIRRLPVVDGYEVVGMVYISDLFHHLLDRLID
jgi:CBS domain-containing protein